MVVDNHYLMPFGILELMQAYIHYLHCKGYLANLGSVHRKVAEDYFPRIAFVSSHCCLVAVAVVVAAVIAVVVVIAAVGSLELEETC